MPCRVSLRSCSRISLSTKAHLDFGRDLDDAQLEAIEALFTLKLPADEETLKVERNECK